MAFVVLFRNTDKNGNIITVEDNSITVDNESDLTNVGQLVFRLGDETSSTMRCAVNGATPCYVHTIDIFFEVDTNAFSKALKFAADIINESTHRSTDIVRITV